MAERLKTGSFCFFAERFLMGQNGICPPRTAHPKAA